MNDAQIWTLIGVFTAVMLGGLTITTTSLSRVIRAEISGLDAKLDGKISGLDARFDAIDRRLDHLDRDVQALTARVWGSERD